jgi:transposase
MSGTYRVILLRTLFMPLNATNVASNESNENEIKRLKKQVLRLTQERDILKKAAAYFAQEIV